MNYSNPRLKAEFNDWPSGPFRTRCVFEIQTHPKHGQRCSRTTVNPRTGVACKPKLTIYCHRAVIVDGDDGRTYILEISNYFSFVTVRRSDFLTAEVVYHSDDLVRFNALRALILSVGGTRLPWMYP